MIDLRTLKSVNEQFCRLNMLHRWTSFVTEAKYNELGKQSLNCITAFILACYGEKNGMELNWGNFPKIALYRAYQKANVYFDMPEYLIDELRNFGKLGRDVFSKVTTEIIAENTNLEFANFLAEGNNSDEIQIYRAATRIATYVELIENRFKIPDQDMYDIKFQEVMKSLDEFRNIPGISEVSDVHGEIFDILQQISRSRNQNRWSVMTYQIDASVLGHLFDTGVFAWLMSLEKNFDSQLAAKMFFFGIWHDVAETWTTDIPSPIKDRIPGFRKITEEFEEYKLQENLYSRLPDFLATAIRNSMFEEPGNEKYFKLIKGADYLSADSECWRQYRAGTRDPYFLGAMKRNDIKIEKGQIEMTPMCLELHKYFRDYAVALNLRD